VRQGREPPTAGEPDELGGPVRLVPELLALPHNGVTVSVHAGDEQTRARLVPHGPSLGALWGALEPAVHAMSSSRRRKTALAYLLLADENDGDAELDAFAERARPLGLSVHLYAHNRVPELAARAVTRARYLEAYARLTAHGLRVRMSSQARLESNGVVARS